MNEFKKGDMVTVNIPELNGAVFEVLNLERKDDKVELKPINSKYEALHTMLGLIHLVNIYKIRIVK